MLGPIPSDARIFHGAFQITLPSLSKRVSDERRGCLRGAAFLAPEIVEAIAAGDQPPELTAEVLAERIDLPLLWTAQAKAVGIAS